MVYLGIFAFVILFIVSVVFRTIVLNPHFTTFYGVKDLYCLFRYKLYNKMPTGELSCYCADFGGGKTLSMAQFIYKMNKRYNGKKFFDVNRGKWVKQHIVVLSNFTVNGVDCVPLKTLQDVVEFTNYQKDYDAEHDTRTCLLVAIDEASCQLNSRNFKSNIDPLFLSTLITCRHFNISFIYSSQTFFLTDKLLRDVTQTVIHCHKIWRIMKLEYYDAHVVENSGTLETLKPNKKKGWFIRDFHFKLYDTLATVENMTKDDSMISYQEILANLGTYNYDEKALIGHRHRKFNK